MVLEARGQANVGVEVAAGATGWTHKPIPTETALRTKGDIATKIAFLQPYWQDLLTRLERTDGDLLTQRPRVAAAEQAHHRAQVNGGSNVRDPMANRSPWPPALLLRCYSGWGKPGERASLKPGKWYDS